MQAGAQNNTTKVLPPIGLELLNLPIVAGAKYLPIIR
jgi:hypothetical protein